MKISLTAMPPKEVRFVPRYQVQSDEIVEAGSAAELVAYLARTSKVPVDARGFRERAAHYAQVLYGAAVRADNDEEFVADMIQSGLYTVISTQ